MLAHGSVETCRSGALETPPGPTSSIGGSTSSGFLDAERDKQLLIDEASGGGKTKRARIRPAVMKPKTSSYEELGEVTGEEFQQGIIETHPRLGTLCISGGWSLGLIPRNIATVKPRQGPNRYRRSCGKITETSDQGLIHIII